MENFFSLQSQATMSPKLMPYAMCSNCGTNNTKLWRRNDKGKQRIGTVCELLYLLILVFAIVYDFMGI